MVIWAFIFISEECDPRIHKAIIKSPGRKTCVYGVGSIEEGCALAKELGEKRIDLIELCGGFGSQGARRIAEAVGETVRVGYVTETINVVPNIINGLYS